jgi:hypothetical protein
MPKLLQRITFLSVAVVLVAASHTPFWHLFAQIAG